MRHLYLVGSEEELKDVSDLYILYYQGTYKAGTRPMRIAASTDMLSTTGSLVQKSFGHKSKSSIYS